MATNAPSVFERVEFNALPEEVKHIARTVLAGEGAHVDELRSAFRAGWLAARDRLDGTGPTEPAAFADWHHTYTIQRGGA